MFSLGNGQGFSEFDIDDFDCNGYSMDSRIETQKRILESIRAEIHTQARELDQITTKYDTLSKSIVDKKNELDGIELEIEVARRELHDWSDKRNVRVSLPHSPLETPKLEKIAHSLSSQSFHSLEEAVDFSRCSITKFLRIYVYPLTIESPLIKRYFDELTKLDAYTNDPQIACFYVILIENDLKEESYEFWNGDGRNHLVINVGKKWLQEQRNAAVLVQGFSQSSNRLLRLVHLDVPEVFDWSIHPPLQPYNRKFLLNMFSTSQTLSKSLLTLEESTKNSMDNVVLFDCTRNPSACQDKELREQTIETSIFTILNLNENFYEELWATLSKGSIPVVLSLDVRLPFEDCIDWREVTIRIPISRFPEIHFILRSIPTKEVIQLRLNGRKTFEHYIGNIKAICSTILACLANQLMLPPLPARQERSIPLFGEGYSAPYQIPINQPNRLAEEEYLGPLEGRIESPKFEHNFTSIQLYAKDVWSCGLSPLHAPEFLPFSVSLPYLKITDVDTGLGLRPIAPGSGKEFKEALGGNYGREDFTIVIPTYNRDNVLEETLKKLHRLKNLNKVVVIWNSVDREPPTSWPLLHVPVEFIKPNKNSLNNRFMPWDRINTEAVLSMDDDIDIRKDEIDLAFRIWRENRDRIVGFPARFHAEFGDNLFYNSNKTCQYSMILTGYAFLNKAYLHMYSKMMHEDVRRHVDEVMNCEDIAMNFLVSSITQKPPLKVTTKWTLRCPNCSEKLSDDESHFNERHECIRLFTKIFGYNPLKNSQYRADSVLFKTRVEGTAQKCYNAV
ncbi:unnamed protein product, partial [Mesorhabditis belari]|uniref:Uncharacterized protein n=1 Tax=Mesorhabditis belari TaxID=2138241 RepID=A0AAF3FDN4_9BILA